MITMDDEINEFMEHFGVKGMHWGVRKTTSKTNNLSKQDQAKIKRAKIAGGIALTGAAVATGIIAYRAGVRLPSIRRTPSALSGSAKSADILKKVGEQRFSAIPMPPVRVPSPPKVKVSSGSSDISALRASIAKTVKLANADLRERDNRLQIPFPERSYIREWN